MKDWLRFGVAWWHTFNQELVDPFGTGTAHRPYYKYTDPMDQALAKVDYAFELFQKLGVEYFCFHDRDIAPEGDTLRETNANLDKVVDKIDENMKSTGVKLLWNTSSLFTNPRFVSAPPLLRSPTSTPTPVASSRRAWRSASAWRRELRVLGPIEVPVPMIREQRSIIHTGSRIPAALSFPPDRQIPRSSTPRNFCPS